MSSYRDPSFGPPIVSQHPPSVQFYNPQTMPDRPKVPAPAATLSAMPASTVMNPYMTYVQTPPSTQSSIAEQKIKEGSPPSSTPVQLYPTSGKLGGPPIMGQKPIPVSSTSSFFGPDQPGKSGVPAAAAPPFPPRSSNTRPRGTSEASDPRSPPATPKATARVNTRRNNNTANGNLYNVFNEEKNLGKKVKALYNKKIQSRVKNLTQDQQAEAVALDMKIQAILNLISETITKEAVEKGTFFPTYLKTKLNETIFNQSKGSRKSLSRNIAERQGVTSNSIVKIITGDKSTNGLLKNALDATVSLLAFNLISRDVPPSTKDLLCKGEEIFQPDKFRNKMLDTIVVISSFFAKIIIMFGGRTSNGRNYGISTESSISSAYNYFADIVGLPQYQMQSLTERFRKGIQSAAKSTANLLFPEGATDSIIKIAYELREPLKQLKTTIIRLQVLYGEKVYEPHEEGQVSKEETNLQSFTVLALPENISQDVIDSYAETSTVLYNTLKYGGIAVGGVAALAVAPILGILGAVTGIGLGAGAVAATGLAVALPSAFMGGKRTRKARRYGKKHTRKH